MSVFQITVGIATVYIIISTYTFTKSNNVLVVSKSVLEKALSVYFYDDRQPNVIIRFIILFT